MRFLKNKRSLPSDGKKIVAVIVVVVALAFVLMFSQWLYLRKAHSTFENYYAFRGCTQLVERTDTFGTCKTASGQTIKIVKFDNKWYLDGDLPWACLGKLCFGI
jgi:hypothetical protein